MSYDCLGKITAINSRRYYGYEPADCVSGEEFGKPVVATCDVHFLDPGDEVYRRIIMAGKHFADADNQAPLYLRPRRKCWRNFPYLGSEKAEEVVITNTVKIADRIDVMAPVRPDKCPPVIPTATRR